MRILTLTALAMLTTMAGPAYAEFDDLSPTYDNEPSYADNTGALSASDSTADITTETGGTVAGTEAGEITIFSDASAVRVYSGFNKVELIPAGSDGWVGSYTVESTRIMFQPAGRPMLACPAQAASPGWFGPCKLEVD